MNLRVAGLFIGLSISASAGFAQGGAKSRVLECVIAFPPDTSEARLAARFGPANVVHDQVQLGEGETDDGTILFANVEGEKVEILWKDKATRARPQWVRVHGDRGPWRTADGLRLGLDLKSIERLNRRPFRLLGFNWDYSGTVMSWSGGRLEPATDAPCHARLRLAPDLSSGASSGVSGDREFSSGHPAMQAANPRVYELWLDYP